MFVYFGEHTCAWVCVCVSCLQGVCAHLCLLMVRECSAMQILGCVLNNSQDYLLSEASPADGLLYMALLREVKLNKHIPALFAPWCIPSSRR